MSNSRIASMGTRSLFPSVLALFRDSRVQGISSAFPLFLGRLLAFSKLNSAQDPHERRKMKGELGETSPTRAFIGARVIRPIVGILGLLFLISAAMNLGYKIPLGFVTLSFSLPSSSIAIFEVVIGTFLLISAILANGYVYGGSLLLAVVGIAEGLSSSEVQGLARSIHETMVPFSLVGWAFLIIEAKTSYRKKKQYQTASARSREVITILQFFVGGLVTLGGASFARVGSYPIGTLLGSIHLAIGLTGLYAAYAFLNRKTWSISFLYVIASVTIAYSALAETLAEIYAYLPRGINDALVGTIIAMIVSAVIIYLLPSLKENKS